MRVLRKLLPVLLVLPGGAAANIRLDGPVSEWEVRCHEGARGSMTEVGKGIYRIVKENAEGILEFRRKLPVELAGPRRWFLRGEYQSRRNVFGTMFFYRLVHDMEAPANYDASGSRTLGPETFLVNTPGNSWRQRFYSIRFNGVRKYHPVILVIGNPAQITLRDLHFTQTEKIFPALDAPDREPEFTRAQVDSILAERIPATAEVVRDADGGLRMLVNGETVTPCAYRNEGNPIYEYMFRNDDFFSAGVPLTSIGVHLCHDLTSNDIVLGIGKYDWKKLDDRIYRAVRRAPRGNFFVAFYLYGPYLDWVKENPGELWLNAKGERGLGNNCHLKYFNNRPDWKSYPEKLTFWPSYSSLKWRQDYAQIIRDVVRHIMEQPYGRAVAGFQFCGGDDGQFQFRNDDYSVPAHRAFRKFLAEKYGSIAKLNAVWKSSYNSFDEIGIPIMTPIRPSDTPFLGPGIKSDYRMFQEDEGWAIRECFARAIKEAAGKKVLTICWGIPDAFSANGLEKMPHLDVQVRPQSYPTRHNGFPYSVHAERSYQIHKIMYFNELDLRSWRSRIRDELSARWLGQITEPEAWVSMHRKVLGPSIAQGVGWWYHTLGYQWGRFYDAPEIMAEIGKVQEITRRLRALPYRKFRPDVCVVADASNNFFIEAHPNAAMGSPNANGNGNGLQAALEVSGVPYDLVYLKDILTRPEFQDYRVYIFRHDLFISSTERMQIAALLKNRDRTLIWIYSSGYVDESGKSAENMRELTGFAIATEEKFARQRVYSVPTHPLNGGRREAMSYVDMWLCAQMPFGLKNIWGSPCQIFVPTDLKPEEIVAVDGEGRPAGGYREFAGWNSLLLTAPLSLTPELLNTVAGRNGCYRTGKAGHNIAMNGNFVSIHPLYDDEYEFIMPTGVTEALDADTGKVIGKAPKITLKLTCGKTVWLFMR